MNSSTTNDEKWNVVRARDASYDGAFVYGVRTTGVYCLPSCSSRIAKRENVCFFATPTEAEAAGLRACKRCHPNQPARLPHASAIALACKEIQTAEEEPDLAALAQTAGLSPGHFQRVFKAQVGLSPKRYAMALRKQRLRDTLTEARSVTHAIFDAGYASNSRAYADGDALGMAPGDYHKGAKGESIRFATASSSLGEIMVARTDRGICMIEFGDQDELVKKLIARFPHATVEHADEALSDLIIKVISLIDAPDENVALPLDIRGTAFQERVWQALTRIPLGQTVSYAELAEKIGQPTAARAVARACATNGIAVAVPCHRVVRGSGAISGYRWGVERKRALLEREAAAAAPTAEKS